MSDLTESVLGSLKTNLRTELQKIAEEAAGKIVAISSVPVEYVGSRVIRSKPGEAPRKERGAYIRTIQSEIVETGDRISGKAFSDSELSTWLEKGTSRMAPRPHFQKVFDDLQSTVPDRLGKAAHGNH